MNESMERVLIEALDLMEQGLGIEEIAARFPNEAADLRPFLLTASALSNLATQPTLTAEARSKRALLEAADRAATAKAQPARAGGLLRRLLAPALALVAILFLGGAGLVGASASAVPGDALYEAKRFIEETRLNFAGDPERAAELREQFRRERLREIALLLADGRQETVSLIGVVESMTGARWTVDGIEVDVSAAAIDGLPVVGAMVQVDGRTAGGVVAAERVLVLASPTPGPTPLPLPTPDAPTPDASSPDASSPTPAATPPDENDNGQGDADDSGEGEAPGAPPIQPPAVIPSATTPSATATAPVVPPPVATQPPPTDNPPPPQPTATPDDDDDNANDGGDDDNSGDDGGGDDGGSDDGGGGGGGGDDDGGSDDDGGGGGGGNDNGGDDGGDDGDGSGGDDNDNGDSGDGDKGGDDDNDNGGGGDGDD